VGIVEGLNPKLIRSKLEAYAHSGAAAKNKKPVKDGKASPEAAVAEG